MPSQICKEPGCAGFVSYRGRCPDHARTNDRGIGRAARPVYKRKKWATSRDKKLSADPLCERCGAWATTVHHKGGAENDPWTMANLESLCASCHSRHHRVGRVAREVPAI